MDLVVDANILFASLIRDGLTAELLFAEDLDIYAPQFLLEEMDKHRELLREKTHRKEADFEKFEKILKRRIRLVPKEELEEWLGRAERLSPDPGDVPYFALALRLGCGIWSNDVFSRTRRPWLSIRRRTSRICWDEAAQPPLCDPKRADTYLQPYKPQQKDKRPSCNGSGFHFMVPKITHLSFSNSSFRIACSW